MNTDTKHPGYQNIIFKPQPAGDVAHASYSNETPNGKAGVDWEKETDKFTLNINVPVGSTATVYVPATDAKNVTEAGKKIKKNGEVRFQRMENGYAVYTVGSGDYSFDSQL
jgi:alpha-L-rhamnosidase